MFEQIRVPGVEQVLYRNVHYPVCALVRKNHFKGLLEGLRNHAKKAQLL